MSAKVVRLKRLAIFVHRWMGACFCLLFAWWFFSGMVMMYATFPAIRPRDRFERAAPLSVERVNLSLKQALDSISSTDSAESVRLAMFDERPAYFIRTGGLESIVYADNGQQQANFPPELNLRTAAQWTGQPIAEAKAEALTDVDQWTIQGIFRRLSPIVKYSWPDGQQVYVSETNGEVVQYTTRSSRFLAYLGAIPHWLYYTPLRKNTLLWSRIVIALSGIATALALLGLVVGVWMYSPSKRYMFGGQPTSIPYHGPKRLHMLLGLFFGVVACTWTFSGMLSMDPFPFQTGGSAGGRPGGSYLAEVLRGGPISGSAFEAKHPREALSQAAPFLRVKQLEFRSVVGEPAYVAAQDNWHSLVIPLQSGPQTEFDLDRLLGIIALASKPYDLSELRVLSEYDAFYLDRNDQKPLPVIMARLNDPEHTRYYIDPRAARVVGTYNNRLWANRWLDRGLHSIDLPWLYKHRPLWDLLVGGLMAGGLALSITAIIISAQFLRWKISPVRKGAIDRPRQGNRTRDGSTAWHPDIIA